MFTALIRLARPKHWIKNVFVLLPVPFALKAGATASSRFRSCWAWPASAWSIRRSTRSTTCATPRPTGCTRRSAAARLRRAGVARAAAAVQIFVLLLAGLGLCFAAAKPPTVAIVLAYVAINVAYNLGAEARRPAGRVPALLGIRDSRVAGLAPGFRAAVAVAAAVHVDAGVVSRVRQAAGRPERGPGPQPSAQPAGLQHVISGPGHDDLRRRGDSVLRPVLHRGEESVLRRAGKWPRCPLWPTAS